MNEIIPRREVVTPVLEMNVNLDSVEAQSRSLSFRYPGRYSVNAQLELRHGPQGTHARRSPLVLAGTAEIVDYQHNLGFRRSFKRSLLDYEVGAKLFEFDTNEVGLKGDKLFRISLNVGPDFKEHYSELKVYIRKELKHPIVD